jgi:hydrophobic/amphiphilic exporter-1 (mainly G- bacteria), HAE1 family
MIYVTLKANIHLFELCETSAGLSTDWASHFLLCVSNCSGFGTEGGSMNLPRLAIRQPVFVLMLMVSLIVVGYIGYTHLAVDLFPNTSNPTVSVSTTFQGAGPLEIQEQITLPIEQAVSTLSGIASINSTSRENLSQVQIQFTLETDPKEAFNNVREKIAGVQRSLPSAASVPTVSQFDLSAAPILSISVADKSGTMKSSDLRSLVLNQIQPLFEQLDGVADVTVNGGQDREIDVNLSLDALRLHRLSPTAVVNAIRNENINVPGGTISQDGKDTLVRVPGEFSSINDIANLPVASGNGVSLRIGDVAVVTDTIAPATTYSRLNGKDSIQIQIRKQSGTNTVAVAQNAKSEMAIVQRKFPSLTLIIANDQSDFIKKSVEDSLTDLILGGVFASAVVFLFFRNFRNTLVTVAGLPFIMIGTFAVMNALGLSLNLMTLLALSLAVGLVLDDAIVVRENIFRHMEHGEDPKIASEKATNEVGLSVVAMSLTIVSVFFPIAFTTGQIGRYYREFGIAVTAAVILSLFEAFTFAPMLSALLFKKQTPKPGHDADEGLKKLNWLDAGYQRALRWTLDHMAVTAIVGVSFLVLLGVVVPRMELSFLPRLANGNFQVGLSMPTGTSLEVTDAQSRKIERILQGVNGVSSVITTVGQQGYTERASFNVQLADFNALSKIEPDVRSALKGIQGLSYNFQGGFGGGGTGAGNRPIQINLLSAGSYDELTQIAQNVASSVSTIPGLADVALSSEQGKPETEVQIDRSQMARYGLNSTTMGSTITTLLSGSTASRFQDPGKEANIVVRLRPEDRARIDDILSLVVPTNGTATAQLIPLSNVAKIVNGSGPSLITRLNQQTEITVGANLLPGQSQAQAVKNIQAKIAQAKLPAYVTVQFGGQVQSTQDALGTMYFSLTLSVIFMYMVLASQFGSLTQPVVLMLALPLAIIGAFGALLVTHTPADMTAVIGLILLMGLAVKNSILLVDFTNRLRKDGMTIRDALLTAGPARLRPVLMTTLALILGMLPVALGLGAGGSFRAPMAIAVIGGLITSTILTLLIVPVAYSLLEMGMIWLTGRRIRPVRSDVESANPSLPPPAHEVVPSDASTGVIPSSPEVASSASGAGE